jgi:hypothetical protein
MRRSWVVALLLAACSDSSSPATKPGSDGGTDDATAPPDGGTTQDQDVGPTYCSTLDPAPFLCVDFDDGAAPADVFTKAEGTPKVEEKGLRVQSDGATDVYVEHEADPSPQWSVIELGFSLRIDDLATDARTVIARIGQHMTDSECRVELELTPSGITLKGGAADAKLTKTVAKGKAARIVVTQQGAPDGGKITANVKVDGQAALAAPVELACSTFPGPPRITLGRITGAGTSDLRFDDVVFDGR